MTRMKSFKEYNILFLLVFVTLLPSCADFLNTTPQDFTTTTNYYKTDDQIYSSLAACYRPLSDMYCYGEMLSFEAIGDDLGYWNYKSSPASIINSLRGWNYNSSQADIERIWDNLYAGVSRCNVLLENIDNADMDSTNRETYRQQARFLRAYYYFLLTNYWGDVPLRVSSVQSPTEVNMARTSSETVMEFIISEIETTISSGSLPEADSFTNAARITQTGAEAILARICLKAAGYPLNMGAEMYQKALDYALLVKQAAIHQLNPNYAQLFINNSADVYDAVYRESIWEAEFYGNSVTDPDKSYGYSRLGNMIGVQSSEETNYGYAYGFVCARLKLTDLYSDDTNDVRKSRNIADFYINSSGSQVTISNVGERTIGKWRRGEETLMPRHKNYTPTNFCIIRYADVLLMIAEAENEINGPTQTAYDALNEVRQRAGAKTYTSTNNNLFADATAFKKGIQDERARELCFEGTRKMDLVRWGIYVTEMQNAATQAENDSRASTRRAMMTELASHTITRDLLFPIPQSEIQLNNLMTQNPMW